MRGVKKVWPAAVAVCFVLAGARALGQQGFRRGDANVDGAVDISDAQRVLDAALRSGHVICPDAADTDDNGTLTIGDGVMLLAYLFAGGATPTPPGPDVPGPDPNADELPCESYEPVLPSKLADLKLGFEGPPAIPGAAGEVSTFDVFATLMSANASTDTGAEAWSIGFEAQGATIKAVSLEGCEAPSAGTQYARHGLTRHRGDGRSGAFSAVLLDLLRFMALPPEGAARITRITLEVKLPASGPIAPITLRYEDGFLAEGRPVKNVVSIGGTSQIPSLGTWTIGPGDCNGNGVFDGQDLAGGTSKDCNGNGFPDECDIAEGRSKDVDGNRIPDECESDCNANQVPDAFEVATGAASDCNRNGIPDDCDRCAQALAFEGRNLAWARGSPSAADLDGDGDMDLAGLGPPAPGDRGIEVILNRGQGTFGSPTAYEARKWPFTLLVSEDLDGDGDMDLAAGEFVGNSVDPTVSVLLNGGNGRFVASGPLPRDPAIWGGVAMIAADLDGDGDNDLAVAESPLTATEASPSSAIALYLNGGKGSFSETRKIPVQATVSLAAADFDHDGDVDLALLRRGPNRISIFSNDGRAAFSEGQGIEFSTTGGNVLRLRTADFNRDGWVDLAALVRDRGSRVHLFQNQEGAFGPGQTIAIETSSESSRDMAIFDADGNGDPDLVVVTQVTGTTTEWLARVLVNGGAGRFRPPQKVGSSSSTCFHCGYSLLMVDSVGFAATGDFDGDGAEDIALPGAILFNRSPRPHSLDANRNRIPDECEGTPFHRGDPNADGGLDIGDGVYLLNYLFVQGPAPTCMESGDTDNSAAIDIADAIGLFNYLFAQGPAPAPPGPPTSECGADPDALGSAGDLGCESYEPCKG